MPRPRPELGFLLPSAQTPCSPGQSQCSPRRSGALTLRAHLPPNPFPPSVLYMELRFRVPSCTPLALPPTLPYPFF